MALNEHMATALAGGVMFGSFFVEAVVSALVRRDGHHDVRDTAVNVVIGAGYVLSAVLLGLLLAALLLAVWSLSPLRGFQYIHLLAPWAVRPRLSAVAALAASSKRVGS